VARALVPTPPPPRGTPAPAMVCSAGSRPVSATSLAPSTFADSDDALSAVAAPSCPPLSPPSPCGGGAVADTAPFEQFVRACAAQLTLERVHEVAPQLRALLRRENAALLADAEDVRRRLARRLSGGGDDDFDECASARSRSASIAVARAADGAANLARPQSALSRSSGTSPGPLSPLPSSRVTPLDNGGQSLTARALPAAEVATSRLRASLLARMNRAAPDVPEMAATTTAPARDDDVDGDVGPEDLRDL
jgi:hypothetical protein